jgi:hypothetical protein
MVASAPGASFGELGSDGVTEAVGGHGSPAVGGDQPGGGAGLVEGVVEEVGDKEHSSFAGEEAASRPVEVVTGKGAVRLCSEKGLDPADGVGGLSVEGDHPHGEGFAGGNP